MALHWRTLQQRGDLNAFRQEVYQLKGHLPFDEVAEFYLDVFGTQTRIERTRGSGTATKQRAISTTTTTF